MNTVFVEASSSYYVKIGAGLVSSIGEEIQNLGRVHKICIVSDSTVYPLYGNIVQHSLQDKSFDVISFVFPAGEESKNPTVYMELMNFLADHQLTRSDLLIAL